MSRTQCHIAIAGDGPTALLLAVACAERGLSTVVVGPNTNLPWPNRYGVWADEVASAGLDSAFANGYDATEVWVDNDRPRVLDRAYVRLDTDRLQWLLLDRLADAGGEVVTGSVIAIEATSAGSELRLDSGSCLRAAVGVDATGARSVLTRRRGQARSFQTAYGIECSLRGDLPWSRDRMTLMDFRTPAGVPSSAVPTFVYAMPLAEGRWFIEETVLTRHPMVPTEALRDRLQRRLSVLGSEIVDATGQEHCILPMDLPRPQCHQHHLAWGAAAAMIHPATGYLIGYAASRAPKVADVLARELATSRSDAPMRALKKAQATVWSPEDIRNDELFRFGASTLAHADAIRYRRFFRAFFDLPGDVWRGYLSRTTSPGDLRNAMFGLFARLSPGMQAELATHVVRQPGRVLRGIIPDPRRLWRSSHGKDLA